MIVNKPTTILASIGNSLFYSVGMDGWQAVNGRSKRPGHLKNDH
ncbi:hypothetical protein SynPROS91_00943 [Synechococcus sp. PROS-9-1]|nr:hypothetical protein SynPROS91_00943 [Synechococcus sp. PROS-9-1]